ncbi:MAG: hypothetical protein JNJ75_09830 [Cyclobacteriaceae bacterium]|nr:hypothetical protein [Cyclobacteriaceae bacterium]
MRNNYFPHLLLGRKLRYDRQQRINESVEDQASFDELFKLIFHHEKLVAQRAMRAIMVVVKNTPEFLQSHAEQLLTIVRSQDYKEIKSYVIQLLPKISLNPVDLESLWHMLTYMALNANEQKNIRTHALQSLYELTNRQATFVYELHDTLNALTYELTPSIQAKVIKLRGLLDKIKVNA